MDLTATLASKNRRWSDGSIEEIRVVFARADGLLDVADVEGIGFGTYHLEPGAFYAPLHTEQLTTSSVAVEILVGGEVRPEGRMYVWGRVIRGDEAANRCCRNDRIDFTDADWANTAPPSTGGPLLTSPTLLTSPSLATSAA